MAQNEDVHRSILERARAQLGTMLDRVERLGEKVSGSASERASGEEADAGATSEQAARKEPRSGFGDPERAVQIFGRRSCFWSSRAVSIVESVGLDYSYTEISGSDGPGLLYKLKAQTGQNTVPFVFVRGRFVGGCDDLERLHRRGELEAMAARIVPP